MHACGHDGHTSILLGAPTVLSNIGGELAGEIRFLFENGEEALPGGAAGMVDAGVMDRVDRLIGLHLWARERLGQIVVRSVRLIAAAMSFGSSCMGAEGMSGARTEPSIRSRSASRSSRTFSTSWRAR